MINFKGAKKKSARTHGRTHARRQENACFNIYKMNTRAVCAPTAEECRPYNVFLRRNTGSVHSTSGLVVAQ